MSVRRGFDSRQNLPANMSRRNGGIKVNEQRKKVSTPDMQSIQFIMRVWLLEFGACAAKKKSYQKTHQNEWFVSGKIQRGCTGSISLGLVMKAFSDN
jgi:hypothetical protein